MGGRAPLLVHLGLVKQLMDGPVAAWIDQLSGTLKVLAVLGEVLFLLVSFFLVLVVFGGLARGASGLLAKLLRKVEQAGRRGFLNAYYSEEET